MEALIILLAEFLWGPIVAFVAVVVECIIGILSLILECILCLFGKKSSKIRKIPGARWLKHFAVAGCVAVVGVLVLIQFIFFDPAVRWVMARAEEKTGIALNANTISGNIFTGVLNLEAVKVHRTSDEKTSFDLEANKVAIDIDLSSLIFQPINIETLTIEGVKGSITQPTKRLASTGATTQAQKIKKKRNFIVEDLDMKEVAVSLKKGEQLPIQLSLEEVKSAPLRSNYAIFDIFFRSTITGSINDHPFSIWTEAIDSGRITKWDIEALPVATLAAFVKKPPLSWLKEGTITVKMEDIWQMGEATHIMMDWRLRMQDVRVEIPDDTTVMIRALAKPVAHYIHKKGGNVEVDVSFVMNEEAFENIRSLDASGLWHALVKGISESIKVDAGQKAQEVKQGIGNTLNRFKGFLDQSRKEGE